MRLSTYGCFFIRKWQLKFHSPDNMYSISTKSKEIARNSFPCSHPGNTVDTVNRAWDWLPRTDVTTSSEGAT